MKRLTPKRLIIAGVFAFVFYLGALQSEGRLGEGEPTGDPNMLTPILALAWPLLLASGIIWAIVRRVRVRKASG